MERTSIEVLPVCTCVGCPRGHTRMSFGNALIQEGSTENGRGLGAMLGKTEGPNDVIKV